MNLLTIHAGRFAAPAACLALLFCTFGVPAHVEPGACKERRCRTFTHPAPYVCPGGKDGTGSGTPDGGESIVVGGAGS
jgi:hypothetical protein